jgi:hypothetical protein
MPPNASGCAGYMRLLGKSPGLPSPPNYRYPRGGARSEQTIHRCRRYNASGKNPFRLVIKEALCVVNPVGRDVISNPREVARGPTRQPPTLAQKPLPKRPVEALSCPLFPVPSWQSYRQQTAAAKDHLDSFSLPKFGIERFSFAATKGRADNARNGANTKKTAERVRSRKGYGSFRRV